MVIREVGVVGCGFMGSGIVQLCAENGYSVTVVETSDEALKRGLADIESHLSRGVDKGRISLEEQVATVARIKGSGNMRDLADCDLVIEATTEILEPKKEIFREMDSVCRSEAILATNTSRPSSAFSVSTV